MIIICTPDKYQVGDMSTAMYTDEEGRIHHNVRFQVMRIATREEYLADYDSVKSENPRAAPPTEFHNFYEVSMD